MTAGASAKRVDLDFLPAGSSRRGVGIVVMIVLHVLVGWALASGLARKAVELVKKPIQMVVLEDLPPPPPPPPPPKVERIQATPNFKAPPPPYVPPPEVVVAAPQAAAAIQDVQRELPKEPIVMAPVVSPPTAPPQRVEVGIACPNYKQVLRAALEGAYETVGVEGTVKVLLRVRGREVVEVTPQGGPKAYYRFVQAAAKRMNCSAVGAEELVVPLDVSFKEE